MKKICGLLIIPILVFSPVSQGKEEAWIKKFNGVFDTNYSSNGVTNQDVFMFSVGCAVHATRVKKNRGMSQYFLKESFWMANKAVAGWSQKSNAKRTDILRTSFNHVHHVIGQEVLRGHTTWQKVDQLCKNQWHDCKEVGYLCKNRWQNRASLD